MERCCVIYAFYCKIYALGVIRADGALYVNYILQFAVCQVHFGVNIYIIHALKNASLGPQTTFYVRIYT